MKHENIKTCFLNETLRNREQFRNEKYNPEKLYDISMFNVADIGFNSLFLKACKDLVYIATKNNIECTSIQKKITKTKIHKKIHACHLGRGWRRPGATGIQGAHGGPHQQGVHGARGPKRQEPPPRHTSARTTIPLPQGTSWRRRRPKGR